jgi:hypothetical protein
MKAGGHAPYAEGWVVQMRLPERDNDARPAAYRKVLRRMKAEVEQQLAEQGYYVPFGPVRMVVARKASRVASL